MIATAIISKTACLLSSKLHSLAKRAKGFRHTSTIGDGGMGIARWDKTKFCRKIAAVVGANRFPNEFAKGDVDVDKMLGVDQEWDSDPLTIQSQMLSFSAMRINVYRCVVEVSPRPFQRDDQRYALGVDGRLSDSSQLNETCTQCRI